MTHTTYDHIKATDRLPSPNGVALELIRLTQSSESTIQEIAAVVEADPATAGRILKAANSCLLAPVHPITCIREAVSLLGSQMVQFLALGFSLVQSHREDAFFDYEAYWGDSLARAVASRQLATTRGHAEAQSSMFTCGLLSQVGRLAFATVYPQTYAMVLEEVKAGDAHALAAEEQSVFDMDHDQLTAALFEEWGLPETFRLAVAAQRDPKGSGLPSDSEALAIARLMHTVGRIVPVVTQSNPDRDAISRMVRAAAGRGFSPDVFPAKFDAIGEEWRELGAVFDVATRRVPPMAELYAQAADTRAGLVEELSTEAAKPAPSAP